MPSVSVGRGRGRGRSCYYCEICYPFTLCLSFPSTSVLCYEGLSRLALPFLLSLTCFYFLSSGGVKVAEFGMVIEGEVFSCATRLLKAKEEGQQGRKVASYKVFVDGLGRDGGRLVTCQVWDAEANQSLRRKSIRFGVTQDSAYRDEIQYSGLILDIPK